MSEGSPTALCSKPACHTAGRSQAAELLRSSELVLADNRPQREGSILQAEIPCLIRPCVLAPTQQRKCLGLTHMDRTMDVTSRTKGHRGPRWKRCSVLCMWPMWKTVGVSVGMERDHAEGHGGHETIYLGQSGSKELGFLWQQPLGSVACGRRGQG